MTWLSNFFDQHQLALNVIYFVLSAWVLSEMTSRFWRKWFL